MDEHGQQFADFGEAQSVPVETQRVSWLGISSLVLGILALPVCCVPVGGSVFGAVAVLLGVAGILAVRRSAGALAGRGMAITGLVLGLLATTASTLFWLSVGGMLARMPTVYTQALDGDPAVVRTVLVSSASTSVSDEQIARFHGAFVATHGESIEVPRGLLDVLGGWAAAGDPTLMMGEAMTGPDLRPVPIPFTGSGGPTVCIVVMDGSEQLGSGLLALADIGFEDREGNMVWLVQGWEEPADDESP